MLKNYILTALRNIGRNFGSTFINISGLVLGLTGAISVYLITTYLLSYDQYHQHAKRIYRVVHESTISSGTEYSAAVPIPFTEAFKSEFPEAEKVSFVSYKGQGLITCEQGGKKQSFDESSGIAFLTPELYEMLDRKWLAGEKKVLAEPNSVVLSERFAIKYFNTTDVVGKSINLDKEFDLKVSGVVENYPGNTHFPFDVLISYSTVQKEFEKRGWSSSSSDDQCYILLSENADVTGVNQKLVTFSEKYNKFDDTGRKRFYSLQSLEDLHLDPRYGNYLRAVVGKGSLITMAIIGAFLLITAIINFINLSTAMAVSRAKEVGIRKVIGGNRTQLVFQFLGETFIIVFVSMLISLGFMEWIILSYINPYLNVQLLSNLGNDSQLLFFLAGLLALVTLLAGLYPSFLLSGYKPVQAIKNNFNNAQAGKFSLRKSLVVFQFFISQLFIIGTITMYSQLEFVNKFDMGFNKDAVVVVPLPEQDVNKSFALFNQLRSQSDVEAVTLSSTPPASTSSSGTHMKRLNTAEDYTFDYKVIDEHYLDVFKIELLAGKNIQSEDSVSQILVNETLVQQLGLQQPHEAIGEAFDLGGTTVHVVGVVKDFQLSSLKRKIKPLFLFYEKESFHTAGIQLKAGAGNDVLETIQKVWKDQYPDHLYAGGFYDQQIQAFYQGEQKLSLMIFIFAGVAVFIGCLGLYGLVYYMARVKMKEIGIRKVMGASAFTIVNMFSKEFAKLLLIAFGLSAPLAWFAMSQFLQNYSQRISLDWQIFGPGILITFVIAFATIAFHTIKSANTNPVKVLRNE